MRVLVITTKSPYPLIEGRALRSYNLIKLAAQQHEVHLLSYLQTRQDADGLEHMRSLCKVVRGVPLYTHRRTLHIVRDAALELFRREPLQVVKYDTAAMRREIKAHLALHRYDVVHLDMLHLWALADLFNGLPVLLMSHNVEAQILERRADNETRPLVRAYLRYQQRKLQRFEARACREARRVVAVSDADARTLSNWSGRTDVVMLPNGVDTDYFAQAGHTGGSAPADGHEADLVYVGGLTWFPNEDAVQYFVKDVLPLVAARVPAVRLTVVGMCPDSAAVRALASHPRVRLLGLVDDIRPHVLTAAVYVVPLRVGGGTRLKILDALSMAKAVVSTSIGCEGIDVTDGRDIVVADGAQDFAARVLELLQDRSAAARLGAAGRQLVRERYDWRVLGQRLLGVYEQATAPKGPHT
jgi:glycosyltransferase involved in cell wall biosynthesis